MVTWNPAGTGSPAGPAGPARRPCRPRPPGPRPRRPETEPASRVRSFADRMSRCRRRLIVDAVVKQRTPTGGGAPRPGSRCAGRACRSPPSRPGSWGRRQPSASGTSASCRGVRRGGVHGPEPDPDAGTDERQHRRAVRDGRDLARRDAGAFQRSLRPAAGSTSPVRIRAGPGARPRAPGPAPTAPRPAGDRPSSAHPAASRRSPVCASPGPVAGPPTSPMSSRSVRSSFRMSGVRRELSMLELQVGVLPPEHPHQRHEVVGGEAGVEADPDLPVLTRPGVARQQPRVLDRAERLPARPQERRAGVGQLDRPVVPVEEPDPEVLLQVHDLLADRPAARRTAAAAARR